MLNEEEIITPDNLEETVPQTDQDTDQEEEDTSTNPQEEEVEDNNTEEEEVSPSKEDETNPQKPDQDRDQDTVEIDGQSYAREELEQIFHIGKSVKKYQETHPGFDPILLHRDYTKKTERLSELEKKLQEQNEKTSQEQTTTSSQSSPPRKSIEDVAKEAGVNPEDVKVVEKIAKSLGFVDSSQIQQIEQKRFQESYDTVKQRKVNKFIKDHPEYHPSQDKDDKNWNTLLGEFNLYKLPENPEKIEDLLEKAHRSLYGSSKQIDSVSAGKVLAQSKVNKVGQSSSSGSSGSSKKTKKEGGVPELAKKYLKGYSEEELQEIFS